MNTRPPDLARATGRRIGLLGGSFDPAHDGHLWISKVALRRLGLDEVWWLVTPQNPLKPDRTPIAQRLRKARSIATDPRIKVTDIETRLRTRFTIDTLRRLKMTAPSAHFVWLMGGDNLIEVTRWRSWTAIFKTMPIAVMARPGATLRARLSKAATMFRKAEIDPTDARALLHKRPPAWVFLQDRLSARSSTAIRAKGEWP